MTFRGYCIDVRHNTILNFMSFRKSVDVLSCAVSAHNKLFIVNAKNY